MSVTKPITLTQERLKELLSYDPESGLFVWRIARGGRMPGSDAGTVTNRYLIINVDRRLYRAHRLAWLYSYGSWPVADIDHIDGDRLNNRISNLRQASRSENMQNQHTARSNNRSGLLGVHYMKRGHRLRRWYSKIKVGEKQKMLGYFLTPEEAHEAYLKAKKLHHPFQTIAT